MGLPISVARFAVIMLPLHCGHSTTSVAFAHAATIRFRMGKVFLSGDWWMGNSETTAP